MSSVSHLPTAELNAEQETRLGNLRAPHQLAKRDEGGSFSFRIPVRQATGRSDLVGSGGTDLLQTGRSKCGRTVIHESALPIMDWNLELRWNSQDSLEWIRLNYVQSKASLKAVHDKVDFKAPLPIALRDLVHQMIGYFETGQPLRGLNWEHLDDSSWTHFQRRVYSVTAKIPFGETRTYSWVAEKIGMPSALRAVGQALRRNPIPILIPCHRVVSAKSLGGFMGAIDAKEPELDFKRRLLSLEEEYRNPIFPFLVAHSQRNVQKGRLS